MRKRSPETIERDRPLLSWLARRAIAAVTPGAHITIEELNGEDEP